MFFMWWRRMKRWPGSLRAHRRERLRSSQNQNQNRHRADATLGIGDLAFGGQLWAPDDTTQQSAMNPSSCVLSGNERWKQCAEKLLKNKIPPSCRNSSKK
jgi:hypothetical protein